MIRSDVCQEDFSNKSHQREESAGRPIKALSQISLKTKNTLELGYPHADGEDTTERHCSPELRVLMVAQEREN